MLASSPRNLVTNHPATALRTYPPGPPPAQTHHSFSSSHCGKCPGSTDSSSCPVNSHQSRSRLLKALNVKHVHKSKPSPTKTYYDHIYVLSGDLGPKSKANEKGTPASDPRIFRQNKRPPTQAQRPSELMLTRLHVLNAAQGLPS